MRLVGLTLAGLGALLAASPALAGEAGWMRYPAISPDGTRVAFAYRGDLWVVPVEGGRATPLTTHEGYETRPVWSPDGRRIAFASDRHGNFDVFLMSAAGGPARRLTFHSANDLPCDFLPGGGGIYFSSHRQDAPESILGTPYHPELHVVPTSGGRPRMALTTPAEWVSVGPDGRVAYQDVKGYEDPWRKHHVSPVTRDIWIWDPGTDTHERVTTWAGEDRNPVWGPEGKLYFLSERKVESGPFLPREGPPAFNVFWVDGEFMTPQTGLGPHPVRFLSIADDGTLCYGYNGEIWIRGPSTPLGKPTRVVVDVVADDRRNAERREVLRDGATEMAVSPDEDEVAFVVKGEVFVASIEHGTTKRLTHTPEQERSLSWAPDGKHLYYAGERGGSWSLYRISPQDPAEERFFMSTVLAEEPVLVDEHESFQPKVSPDGKSIAFLQDRDALALLDLETRRVGVLVKAEQNYSYADGDISFAWSPDSQWLAVTYLSNRSWIENVGVVSVRSGAVRDVTRSGYYETRPTWSRDGRALLFISDRMGRRSHGSWGSEDDVFALYLTQEAYDRATLTQEELEILEEEEDDENGDEDDEREKRGRKGKRKKADEPPPTVTIEEGRYERRTRRLTLHSALAGSYVLSNDGEVVLYFAQVENKWDVWMSRPRKGETRRLLALGDDRGGDLALSEDGKTLYVRRGDGKLARARVGGALDGDGKDGAGRVELEGIGYAAELTVSESAVREHLFEHVWRQAGKKFYDPQLHGVDWQALRANYVRFLPELENDRDFAELLSEMLGELNASHTGCRYRPRNEDGDATASLGLLYDPVYEGPGLRVAEIIPGGPCAQADSRVRAGDVVTHIDGTELTPTTNPWPLLNRKAGKRVRLTLRSASGAVQDQVLKAISDGRERQLLYERLVERRRSIVVDASGGRLGYVHVRGMNDASFRTVFREALGRHGDAEGLVVDTRFNGGGWLHDDLVVFLSGKPYAQFVPRGKERGQMGGEPIFRWARPSVVLQSEGNYSDAHIFPWAYRLHGLGKLVGTGVAGTGTAVWWERLMEPTLVFGIPQVGMVTPEGEYLENQTLEPDVLVFNDPVEVARGVDRQLLKAVEVLLAELK